MQTKSIIQASANVIRITKLVKGDVVKLFKDENYGDKIKYAIVMDVVNDGEKTFVEFMVYNKSYGEVKPEVLVLSGKDDDYSIFPATQEELNADFEYAIERIKNDIEEKLDTVAKSKKMLKDTEAFVSGETSKKLTSPEFNEITQLEYQQEKAKQLS